MSAVTPVRCCYIGLAGVRDWDGFCLCASLMANFYFFGFCFVSSLLKGFSTIYKLSFVVEPGSILSSLIKFVVRSGAGKVISDCFFP